MAVIIDGKTIAKKTRENLKKEVEELKKSGITPKLAVIMVGNNPASKVYVKNKSKAFDEVGIEYEEYILEENIKQEQLKNLIEKLNKDNTINGILLQSPLPANLDINEAIKKIDYNKYNQKHQWRGVHEYDESYSYYNRKTARKWW